MKTCPHCNLSCEDTDIVCKNCGYLFNAENIPYPPENGAERQASQQPQQAYQQPVQNSYSQPDTNNFQAVPDSGKTNGLAIAGMVLGIIGVAFGCCMGFGLIAAIPGIILSILAIRKIGKTGDRGKGMAIAGIVCSAVGILLGGYMLVSFIVVGQSPAFWDTLNQAMQKAKESSSQG